MQHQQIALVPIEIRSWIELSTAQHMSTAQLLCLYRLWNPMVAAEVALSSFNFSAASWIDRVGAEELAEGPRLRPRRCSPWPWWSLLVMCFDLNWGKILRKQCSRVSEWQASPTAFSSYFRILPSSRERQHTKDMTTVSKSTKYRYWCCLSTVIDGYRQTSNRYFITDAQRS